MNYIIGIDIGTQGTKGILINEDLQIVARLYVEHGISGMVRPGWAEHDPERVWWNEFKYVVREILKKISSKGEKILVIGCSALGGMVSISSEGTPLTPGFLYNDTRHSKEISEVEKKLGETELIRRCKNTLSSQFIGPKIIWLKKNNPKKFKQTHKILTPSGYIIYKLTGSFVLDYSQAPLFNPFYNYDKMAWDKEICAEFHIPYNLLPQLKWPTDLAGKLTRRAARELGLVEGTPVITSTIDGLAEMISMGIFEEEVMGIVYGSACALAVPIDKNLGTKELYIRPHPVVKNKNLIGGMTATSCALVNWFKENFISEEKIEMKEKDIYELLNQKALEIVPGSNGILVLPYFSGERTPLNDALARGLIIGLTTYHSRIHIYRALLEGIAYTLKHNFDLLESYNIKFYKIRASGGGIKNDLLLHIVSDVANKPQTLLTGPTGAEIGTAYLAAIALGIISDLQKFHKRITREGKTILPNKENYKIYRDYYRVYQGLYAKTKQDMHTLAKLSSIKF